MMTMTNGRTVKPTNGKLSRRFLIREASKFFRGNVKAVKALKARGLNGQKIVAAIFVFWFVALASKGNLESAGLWKKLCYCEKGCPGLPYASNFVYREWFTNVNGFVTNISHQMPWDKLGGWEFRILDFETQEIWHGAVGSNWIEGCALITNFPSFHHTETSIVNTVTGTFRFTQVYSTIGRNSPRTNELCEYMSCAGCIQPYQIVQIENFDPNAWEFNLESDLTFHDQQEKLDGVMHKDWEPGNWNNACCWYDGHSDHTNGINWYLERQGGAYANRMTIESCSGGIFSCTQIYFVVSIYQAAQFGQAFSYTYVKSNNGSRSGVYGFLPQEPGSGTQYGYHPSNITVRVY